MLNLKTLDYNKPLILDENILQKMYIEKTYFKTLEVDQYFIRLYARNCRGDFVQQGYIYFGLDFLERISLFIGVYIKPEFRNSGLSNLLLSVWMQLCFENGIYNLGTISNQRKPFVIYLLKRYSFELKSQYQYLVSGSNIYICRNSSDIGDKNKYLLFQNADQKSEFIKSAVATSDNYNVLNTLPSNFDMLDRVLLKNPYFLQDESNAYGLSLERVNHFRTL